MNAGIIAEQMLILFLMMATGYLVYRRGMITAEGARSLNSLIINVCNPCLVITGVLNKEITYSARMVGENIVLAAFFFAALIVLSWVVTRFMALRPEEVGSYRMMMIFPNLGYMGIPLVRSLYGEEAVLFVSFYIVGYNLLVYSYGILLTAGSAGGIRALPWRKMCNLGMAASVAAIVIFALRLRVPEVVESYVSSVGNAAIPLSMMAVGITVAQSDLRQSLRDKRMYLMVVIVLLILPVVCIPLMRLLPIDPVSYGIFVLFTAMPVGSVVMLVESEYGRSGGRITAPVIALTSVLSVVTIPIVALLA